MTGGKHPAPALAAPWCHAWAVLLSLSSSVVQGCPCRARHLRHSSAWEGESHLPHPFRHATRQCERYQVSLGDTEAASIWADCCLCWGPISLWLPWQASVCISGAGCGLAGCVRDRLLLEAPHPGRGLPVPVVAGPAAPAAVHFGSTALGGFSSSLSGNL